LGRASKEQKDKDILEVLKEAENAMYKNKLKQSREAKNNLISSLEGILGEKQYETGKHIKRLEQLVIEMGRRLGLSNDKLEALSLLANLHDIGKVAIDDNILLKPDGLTTKEWRLVKGHPEIGYHIIKSSSDKSFIADFILSHHEWWDGSGYPQGLEGEEIPLLARVLAIADAYDVMTRGRPYKDAISKEEAIFELRNCAEDQFDPELVELFIKLIND
jgi:HD-GYP domain-containing protein (c-di-GMP phosphodiesterase class II)